MKNIKLLFIMVLAFGLFALNVNAYELNTETGEVSVAGKVLYQKGSKTSETLPGVKFDAGTMTLTLNKDFKSDNGEGIKVIDMGDNFIIVLDGEVDYEVKERNDGLFISGSKVTIKKTNEGSLKVKTEEGSGIIINADAYLVIEDIVLDVPSVRFGENGILDIWNTADIKETKLYKAGVEIERLNVSVQAQYNDEVTGPQFNNQTGKTRDKLSDIIPYIIVAGLLVVGCITVLFTTIKNQKK